LRDTHAFGPEPTAGGRSTQVVDTVCVFRSADLGRVSLAKSILQSADVPFLALNEALQHLAWRRAARPVELLVSRSEAEDARAMVSDLEGWTGTE